MSANNKPVIARYPSTILASKYCTRFAYFAFYFTRLEAREMSLQKMRNS